jgi:hypothetical protein
MSVRDACGYDFVHDLKDIDITKARVDLPHFPANGNNFYISFQSAGSSIGQYGCYMIPVNPSAISPGKIRFRLNLVNKMDNRIIKTQQIFCDFLKRFAIGAGKRDCILTESIRDQVLKIKICQTFSDFINKPDTFEAFNRALLFNKTFSNFSFKVVDEVVYVLHGILTTRCDYFGAMLEGSFKEAQVPITVDAEIPIHGVNAAVFKMIIEWIYTMDIRQLNDKNSPTPLASLEAVYVAADMYLITDLCDTIVKYLESLLNMQTFGEIYQIAKRISNKSLEKTVFKLWISNSIIFNENDAQINILIQDEKAESAEQAGTGSHVKTEDLVAMDAGQEYEVNEGDVLYGISRKIIEESNWDGDKESKLCVIKYLSSTLSLDE